MITTFAIFAGGQSRRMGTDKAALTVEGVTLLERTARITLTAGQTALIIGRTRPDGWPLEAAKFVEDAVPGLGPLGGLHTALGRHPAVCALACDLPLLTPDAVRWLGAQAEQNNKRGGNEHGLIVVNHGRWEPLFSVYHVACLPLIESRLTEGKRSLHGLIEAGDFAFADAPDWVCAQLVNVNTPEDWQTLEDQKRTEDRKRTGTIDT